MSKILTIKTVISPFRYKARDSAGKVFTIDSTVAVRKGQTVLVKNDRVTGVIKAEAEIVYNV